MVSNVTTACEVNSACGFPMRSSKNASFPVKATKLCGEGSRAVGFGHLGPFSNKPRTGSGSGFLDDEMVKVGNIMKLCFSLSTLNTVPDPVILAGILQAPTGSSADTATGLNCKNK